MSEAKETCPICGGLGYTIEAGHHPCCDGDCHYCPIQGQVRCHCCEEHEAKKKKAEHEFVSEQTNCCEGKPGKEACCARAGEYNGFGSGPLSFVCPKHCPCHD